MQGLIIKDFLVLKSFFLINALLTFISMPMFLFTDRFEMFVFLWVPLLWMSLSNRAFMQDEKSRCEVILNSLPLSRAQIVIVRYLSALTNAVYSLLLVLVFAIGVKLAGLYPKMTVPLSIVFTISAGLIVVVMSITYPFNYRFGFQKGNYLMMFLLFVPFIGIAMLAKTGVKAASWIGFMFGSFARLGDPLKIIVLVGLASLLVAASMAASIRLYRTREF